MKRWSTPGEAYAYETGYIEGRADVVEVRDDVTEWCTDCKEYDKERHCCPRFNRVIEETVAEIKTDGWQKVQHGRWEYVKKRLARGGYVDASECSVCHKIIMPHLKPNYCPNCGARMDEVEE